MTRRTLGRRVRPSRVTAPREKRGRAGERGEKRPRGTARRAAPPILSLGWDRSETGRCEWKTERQFWTRGTLSRARKRRRSGSQIEPPAVRVADALEFLSEGRGVDREREERERAERLRRAARSLILGERERERERISRFFCAATIPPPSRARAAGDERAALAAWIAAPERRLAPAATCARPGGGVHLIRRYFGRQLFSHHGARASRDEALQRTA